MTAFTSPSRNVAMGGCTFWTRVGGMVAPQILLIVSKVLCVLYILLIKYIFSILNNVTLKVQLDVEPCNENSAPFSG